MIQAPISKAQAGTYPGQCVAGTHLLFNIGIWPLIVHVNYILTLTFTEAAANVKWIRALEQNRIKSTQFRRGERSLNQVGFRVIDENISTEHQSLH
jgi:hypothetical protein